MATYHPPVRDIRFVLHELLEAEQTFTSLPGFEEATADVIDAVLEEGGRICESVVFPTNRTGDVEGVRLADGAVTTPVGFKEAYDQLREGGWLSLGADPDYGGQGLPHTLSVFFEEMLQSANMAFALYPGLTRGACIAMRAHADEALKQAYLPKMISGEWAGVMCLTEPHCGTDLGLLRTRAEPRGDGSYAVTGTKIFITGGEQDLTPNIVHLVLARLPDAPPGVKGISMFLVPKFLPDADGEPGERNAVHCASIEKKMGIKGASTCVMNYDGATGWMVGEAHKGLRAMFAMMNHERLMVGQQGLSQAELAYQSAAAYARERLQGRALTGAAEPDLSADPIIVHPDVRRMLLTARALNESARALLGWAAMQIDIAERHPDAATKEAAQDHVALLIPVIKAYFTDYGFDACNQCLQVLGGHGYIAEWGMEQLVRDARIAQIYEGANGIHALDLVGRKLPMHDGRLIKRFLGLLDDFLREHGDDARIAEFTGPLAQSVGLLKQATAWIATEAGRNPDEVGAASYDYLRLLALTSLGWMWAWSAKVAVERVEGDNTGFYRNKLITGRFFVRRLLPQVKGLADSLSAGAGSLMELEAEAF
jgi:alkylation response protein AidB-like acyl-CoA dehydrogenase